MADRKMLRKRPDGSYEGLALTGGSASYDKQLTPEAARKMWALGGYEEISDEDAADFEAARLIAGVDTDAGAPEEIQVRPRPDGDDDASNDQFDIERRFKNGSRIGQTGDSRLASTVQYMGDARVKVAPGQPRKDFNDAKLDGLSNPSARPAQDWSDGPRNASPMPRAGQQPAAKRPGVQVGMPAARDTSGLEQRVGQEATRQQPQPGTAGGARRPGLGDAYALQRAQGQGDPLAAARQQSNRSAFGVRLARAGAMANEALTGTRLDRGAWDDLEKDSEQPLEDLAARRGMAREDTEESRRSEDLRMRGEDADWRRTRDARDFDYRKGRDAAEDELANRRLTADERQAAQQRALQWASLKEQREGRRASEDSRRQERAGAAAAKEQQMRERQDEKDMAELGKRTDKLTQVKADVETVNKMLASNGDIPGAGVWDSVKMDNAVTRALFASKDDVESWQAGQRMVANYLSTMTGQSFTLPEAERTLQRYGVRTGSTEQEWRSGMTAFIRDAKAGLIQKEAPFKHVVPEFRARGGVTAQDIPAPAGTARPTGRTIRMPNGQVYDVLDNGKARPRG